MLVGDLEVDQGIVRDLVGCMGFSGVLIGGIGVDQGVVRCLVGVCRGPRGRFIHIPQC